MELDPDTRRLQEEIRQHLQTLDTRYVADAPQFGPWHRAAAVLTTFTDALEPDLQADDRATGGIEDVLADAEPVGSDPSTPVYELQRSVRREVLRTLGTREAMAHARQANPGPPDDPTQSMLDAYLTGKAPPLASQTPRQLAASFDVAAWLSGILPDVPDEGEVRAHLDRAYLLAPFRELTAHFSGRAWELEVLRDYVGVLPPASAWSWVKRRAEDAFSWHEKPPLVIHGTGGVGKSTLVAQFILEHMTSDVEKRFPFAYLDFDRPDILPSEPLTLLAEAVRQLGLQWPRLRGDCEALRARWWEQIEIDQARAAGLPGKALAGQGTVMERSRYIGDFARLLQTRDLADRPLLLVLDTFEQVQTRSAVYVEAIWRFLEELQSALPRLRAVFSGRAKIDGVDQQELPLLHLDPDAARGFLSGLGLPSDVTSIVVSRVGGNPLSLRMAASLLARLQKEHGPAGGISAFQREVGDAGSDPALLQRLLYERILEHVADDDVRKLAHPGLVLRRLSPSILVEVLAGPCDVAIADLDAARDLLRRMQAEVWLVTRSGTDEVVHRQDVRRLMLRPMLKDARLTPQVSAIQSAAVDFYAREYERRKDAADRAEEIYQRLLLGQATEHVDPRWLPGVERHLYAAVDDLAPAPRAWLSSRLSIELDEAARSQASLEAWERDAERRATELLSIGEPERALAVVRERDERSASGPLFVVEAQVLTALGDLDGARDVLQAGLQRVFETGNDTLRPKLLVRLADAERLSGRADDAWWRLNEAEVAADSMADRPASLAAALARLDIAQAEERWHGEVDKIRSSLAALVPALTDEETALDPDAVRRAAGEAQGLELASLRRVLRIAGAGHADAHAFLALGEALERWDRSTLPPRPSGPAPLNTLALAKLLERDFSQDEVLSIYEVSVRPALLEAKASYVPDIREIMASDQPVRRMMDLLERTGSLEMLARAVESVRPGSTAMLRKSCGSIARFVDLQTLSEDGTIENAMVASPTSAGQVLDRIFAAAEPPPDVREAVAVLLRYEPPQQSEAREPRRSHVVVDVKAGSSQATRELLKALVSAFPSLKDLRALTFTELDVNLESITSPKPLTASVLDLIEWAEANGRLAELVTGAQRQRPGNEQLRKVVDALGLRTIDLTDSAAGAMARALGNGYAAWRAELDAMVRRVCRVQFGPAGAVTGYGTGFLIGPDLVMTARHVGADLVEGRLSTRDVSCLFDFRQVRGVTLAEGTTVRLARNGLVTADEPLDFAVLRLERHFGEEPPGRGTSRTERERGWVDVARALQAASGPSPLTLLHHAAAGPLRVSIDLGGVTAAPPPFIEYRLATEGGSGGAPCFNARWEPVALHQGKAAAWLKWNTKRGIDMRLVAARLRELLPPPRVRIPV